MISILTEFKHDYFPQYLSIVISNVQKILLFQTYLSIVTTEDFIIRLNYYKKRITNKFKNFNVFFEDNSILITPSEIIDLELSVSVRKLNDYFKEFNIDS